MTPGWATATDHRQSVISVTRIRGISKTTHTKVVCKPTLRPKRRNRDKLGTQWEGKEGSGRHQVESPSTYPWAGWWVINHKSSAEAPFLTQGVSYKLLSPVIGSPGIWGYCYRHCHSLRFPELLTQGTLKSGDNSDLKSHFGSSSTKCTFVLGKTLEPSSFTSGVGLTFVSAGGITCFLWGCHSEEYLLPPWVSSCLYGGPAGVTEIVGFGFKVAKITRKLIYSWWEI